MNQTFKIGEVVNPIKNRPGTGLLPVFKTVSLSFPSRLNAMALDPSKIAVNENAIYSPGEVIFAVSIYKNVTVSVRNDSQIHIESNHQRKQLIEHSVKIMQKALGINNGFDINFLSEDIRHTGLGSSSGLIAATATAINHLYGNPIQNIDLIQYLAQNHGEEIDGDIANLQHVQCIGGGAAAGLIAAGMIVLAGDSVPIAATKVDARHKVIIGIHKDFISPDAKTLMELENQNMGRFIETGNKFGEKIAYRLVHETIPNMVQGKLYEASKLIFDYRFDYGSIENCSFVYPPIIKIAENLRYLFEKKLVGTLALSSVGPAFFAITDTIEDTERVFQENGLKTIVTTIHNDGYKVLSTLPYENI